ncbi:MAG: hypothetical protein JEZ07_19680 [Phycisphaerae bacterium]|nr:hypothetical protein [Phycisphaerae bacterium]
MENKDLQKILNEDYDDSKENTLREMLSDFYNRQMISNIVIVWTYGITMMVLTIIFARQFYLATEVKSQIMHAVLAATCFSQVGLIKIFAWQMIHRNALKREIKKLELTIAQLNEAIKSEK